MEKVAKVLVALIGIAFVYIWGQWVFGFDSAMQQWAVQATSLTGTNNLRGDMGGIFLALAVFCGLYFLHGKIWLKAGIVLMGCIAVMRAFSLVVDGYDAGGLQSMLVEIAFIVVFLLAPAGHRH